MLLLLLLLLLVLVSGANDEACLLACRACGQRALRPLTLRSRATPESTSVYVGVRLLEGSAATMRLSLSLLGPVVGLSAAMAWPGVVLGSAWQSLW